MLNFITPAYAQSAGGAPSMETIMQFAPFAIILVIMYFLILRPQQKRAKEHQELVGNVRRGDTVVTSGGIIGKVTKSVAGEADVEVEIADRPGRPVALRHPTQPYRGGGPRTHGVSA